MALKKLVKLKKVPRTKSGQTTGRAKGRTKTKESAFRVVDPQRIGERLEASQSHQIGEKLGQMTDRAAHRPKKKKLAFSVSDLQWITGSLKASQPHEIGEIIENLFSLLREKRFDEINSLFKHANSLIDDKTTPLAMVTLLRTTVGANVFFLDSWSRFLQISKDELGRRGFSSERVTSIFKGL